MRAAPNFPRTTIGFAHRGASARAPENTLPAFALALELGATGLESDVWLTADGVPVLDHDGVVDGRPIGELARRELPAHIPELADLYRECGADFELSLDVKDEAAAKPTVDVARAAGALPRLWLCQWSWRRVAEYRALSPEIRLVDSTRAHHMRTPPAERAGRMVAHGIDALNLHHGDWQPAWIEALHAAGRVAFAWDAQEEETVRALVALGIDAVYSDYVDRMMRALADASR